MNNLDKLIAEKERLQKQLDFAEQKIKDYKNKTAGIPRVGSNAYFLEGNGVIICEFWEDNDSDWKYWNQGNAFLSYDEAIAESKRRETANNKKKRIENTGREDVRTEKLQWEIDSECMEEEQ